VIFSTTHLTVHYIQQMQLVSLVSVG